MTIREAYAQGSADLKFAEIPSPALDASLLLAHVLNTNRTSLIAKGMDTIPAKICEKYCSLIERRALGECVAYIIGKKEFRGLEFEVNKSVLVPRPDTETLVEAAIGILSENLLAKTQSSQGTPRKKEENIKILDICTGSGAIAIALKNEKPELEVHATDISPTALKVAVKNSENLLGKNKICFYQGDIFNSLNNPISSPIILRTFGSISVSPCDLFPLIVSNPPYIPSAEIETLSAEVQNEPRLALDGGSSGLEIIKRIIEEAPNYLQKGGFLLLEAAPSQTEEIKTLLAKRGFTSLQLFKDLSGADRVIGGKFEK